MYNMIYYVFVGFLHGETGLKGSYEEKAPGSDQLYKVKATLRKRLQPWLLKNWNRAIESEQESTELFTHYKNMSVTGKIHESHVYFMGMWFWMNESWMHFDRSQTK